MRKAKLFLFKVLILFFISNSSKATHVIGAEISYRWVSGNTFKVELSVFRDCASPVNIANRQKVYYSAFSCQPTQDSISMVQTGPPIDVSPICSRAISNCKGGTNPGIQKYRFEGSVTLPAQCSDWVFYYRECNRSANIGTVVAPQNSCLYIEARLNNLLAPNNSSPRFSNDPVSYLCVGQEVNVNPGVIDPDGDQLRFRLVNPRSNSIIPNITDANVVKFKPEFSATNPLPTQNGFLFDSLTGQASFVPSSQIVGVTAIRISEFRNGKLIGSTMQDIQWVIKSCQNSLPVLSGFDNGSLFEKLVCLGDTLDTQFTATDASLADSIKLTWNFGVPNGEFTSDTSSLGNNSARLKFVPTLFDTGNYVFTITAKDNNCPNTGGTTMSYLLKVREKPTATFSLDTTIPCGATIPILISELTGRQPFNYSWAGRPETTAQITVGHGSYTGTLTDATGCSISKTILVKGSSINGMVLVDTSCLIEGVQLRALATSTLPNVSFTYQWTILPEVQGDTGIIFRKKFTTQGPKSGTLKINSSDNCTIDIPFDFIVCPPPPVLATYAPNVCMGQQIRIGCGIPGLGGYCGALLICIKLERTTFVSFPTNGSVTIPGDSLRPDSNIFQVITTSFNGCRNSARFKFKVKPSPGIRILPNASGYAFNCNAPDTTILVKIFKDYRFPEDSLWGRITYADTTIDIPKTINDTIFYRLRMRKPGVVVATGIMASNCRQSAFFSYLPLANAAISVSNPCREIDTTYLGNNGFTPSISHFRTFIPGVLNDTSLSALKIPFPPNLYYNGYFMVEDTNGCRDTMDFSIDTRMPDTTVIVSADSVCQAGLVRLQIVDTSLVFQWKFQTDTVVRILNKPKMIDSLTLYQSGWSTINSEIRFRNCYRNWDLPAIWVRPPIVPKVNLQNVCGYDSTRLFGEIEFSENPITEWKWNYNYPPGIDPGFNSDSGQNASRIFGFNGRLKTRLTLKDNLGCLGHKNLDTNLVLVSKPEFDVNGNCQNDSLVFFFGRVPDLYETIDKFTYFYESGKTETTSNGQGLYQFPEPGIFDVILRAYSDEGCTNSDTARLEIKPRPKAVFEISAGEICQGQNIVVDAKKSKPAAENEMISSFVWASSLANPHSSDTATQFIFPDTGPAFIALQVKSTNGCQDYLRKDFQNRPRPIPDFEPRLEDLESGDEITFLDKSIGGSAWRWVFGDGNSLFISDSSQNSPSHKYTTGEKFVVKQWVVNGFGCADSISKPLNLKSFIALPTAFSPNGDQKNDGLGLIHRYIKDLVEFKVFNRLGQVVFDAGKDLNARWNGQLNGNFQPNGSYLYVARATSVFGENLELKGSVTLVR
jgi:gliding motility-associated-like protein